MLFIVFLASFMVCGIFMWVVLLATNDKKCKYKNGAHILDAFLCFFFFQASIDK